MTRRFEGERTLMRIFLGESARSAADYVSALMTQADANRPASAGTIPPNIRVR